MERREYLKTAGGIGMTALLGGVGVLATTGGAAATSSELTIDDTSLSNDDGDVNAIGVSLSHDASFDGFDVPVYAASYRDTFTVEYPDGTKQSHVLYDQLQHGNGPVLISNMSRKNDDGTVTDGWGGDGEYFVEGQSDDDSNGYTAGTFHADIDWNLVAEGGVSEQKSIEQTADAANFDLDNPKDGEWRPLRFTYKKTVFFYTADSSGPYTSADGSTSLARLGTDDGTVSSVTGRGHFKVSVKNEAAEASSSSTDGESSAS